MSVELAKTYDAIVVGGSHDGLICATYLAKAGKQVLVLAQPEELHATAKSRAVVSGFTFSAHPHIANSLAPRVVRDLALVEHGYQVISIESSFSPFPDSRSLCRWSDVQEARREIAKFSSRDSENYPAFLNSLTRVATALNAPRSSSSELGASNSLNAFADGMCDGGSNFGSLVQELRLSERSAGNVLDNWFESDQLKAALACSALHGTNQSLRSDGSATALISGLLASLSVGHARRAFVRGGEAQLTDTLVAAAKPHGVEIHAASQVERMLMHEERCVGIALNDGDEFRANVVISALHGRGTQLDWSDQTQIQTELAGEFARPGLARVNLALERTPEFACRPGSPLHLRGEINIAPSLDYLERAFEDARAGLFSKQPIINAVVPSLVDSTLAPAGKHVMSCYVQFVPRGHTKVGANQSVHREELGDKVIDTLEEYIPDLQEIVSHRQVLMPEDLNRGSGGTHYGRIFHIDPIASLSSDSESASESNPFQTPIRQLWTCQAGALTAQAILESGSI